MAQFNTYDPSRVIVSFNGKNLVGMAEGTFVSAERAEDAATMSVGTQGDVVRVRSLNRTGSVTVTLQASSVSNEDLMAAVLSEEAGGSAWYGPLYIKDLNGNTRVEAQVAWVRKLPTTEFASDASNREWVFDCHELIFDIGGSALVE